VGHLGAVCLTVELKSVKKNPELDERQATLLIVDDHDEARTGLVTGFAKLPYRVLQAATGEEGIRILQTEQVDVVVTDMKMPGASGLQVFEAARECTPPVPVILLTAFGTIEQAVDAMASGLFHYMTKPVNLKDLRVQVTRAIEHLELRRENLVLRKADRRVQMPDMIGESKAMQDLQDRIKTIADTRATVLIDGESGTGKELVARALHRLSSRRNRPFVPIHCAALSESLIESELFGHEKGAFTGAAGRRQGVFELAHEGTIFLDEISNVPLSTQVKLLRVLENREFMRVGGVDHVHVDVRVVAATNRNLLDEVEEERFREDLYYRLNVVRIEIPPLRARAEDIPLLLDHYARVFCTEHNKPMIGFTPEAQRKLVQYPWPGNVRQLRNLVENLVLFSRGRDIDVSDLPAELEAGTQDVLTVRIGEKMDLIEKRVLEWTLQAAERNRTKAAELLGISRRTLLRKIKELNLE
jgi:DNA-binding NtrC family response regulator